MRRLATAVLLAAVLGLPAARADQEPANPAPDIPVVSDDDDVSRAAQFEMVKAREEQEDPAAAADAVRLFNLYGPFRFPNDALYDVVLNRPRVNAIFGADISHYTADSFPIESLVRKKVQFVYVKASQGLGQDAKFYRFWKRLGELPAGAKVHRGAYHFLTARSPAAEQAATYVKVLKANGGLLGTDLPPVVDFEWDVTSSHPADYWIGHSADSMMRDLKTFLTIVEAQTGRRPVIYTSRTFFREKFGSDARFAELAGYPVWICDYSKSSRGVEVPKVMAGARVALWQFSYQATMAQGYDTGFDVNVFKGTQAQFDQSLGVKPF